MAEGAEVCVEHFVCPEVNAADTHKPGKWGHFVVVFSAGIELAGLLMTITADPKALEGKVSFWMSSKLF